MKSISIVIPCYHCEASIKELAEEILQTFEGTDIKWEAILVNDGSTDKTWQEISQLAKKYNWVTGINLSRNFGQHNALYAGILATKNELIVTMDDDLQHSPADIIPLISTIEKNYDLVYATPEEEQHSKFRNIASVTTKYLLEKTLNIPRASDTSAFRIFNSQLIDVFKHHIGPFVDIDAILAWGTKRVGTITVQFRKRKYGQSNYSVLSLISHTIKMIESYSQVPLRISSMMGVIFFLFGMALLIRVLSNYYIYGGAVEGFTFLAVIIIIFSGIQLLAIGIIGEYIGRLHQRSMGKPIFLIREKIDSSKNLK